MNQRLGRGEICEKERQGYHWNLNLMEKLRLREVGKLDGVQFARNHQNPKEFDE